MKRRTFIKSAAVAAASLNSPAWAEAVKKPGFGVQLFTIPSLVDTDMKGALRLLAGIGYKEVEFFGPYPFSDPETIERWKQLAGMLGLKRNAFYGYTVQETAGILKEAGLKCNSIHLDLPTFRRQMDSFLKAVGPLGIRYAALPALWEDERKTLDDYKRRAEEFNAIGKRMKKEGITFVYHNHGFEHAEKEGEIPMIFLLNNTDKAYVQFELDIFWMKVAGADPIEFLNAYPGRFKLMHLKDAAVEVRFAGDGGSPDQWMPLFPKMADPGDGVFPIPAILAAARKSGVEHFFLERDLAPDPESTLRNSYKNLSQMR
jgi:sugar phosphate isomerase/epimerase